MKKHGILRQLLKNNDIVILRPDKGNNIIMDRNVYIQKIFEIMTDRTKFKELSIDPTNYLRKSTAKILKIYEGQANF